MRILFLSPRQCWPSVSGAKLREYYFARALGRRASLTYVFFSEPGAPPVTAANLPFCRSIVPVPAPRMYSPAQIVRGLAGRWPLPAVNYTSEPMKAALAGVLQKEQFDLVHVDYVNMAPYAPILERGGAPRLVYNWHNIESELMRRYSRTSDSSLRRLYARWTTRRLAALEKRILRRAFGHVVCSERESQALCHTVPEARIVVVENGVDTASFEPVSNSPAERDRLVFVGSMAYHANIDAAVWFVRSIWPAVRERFPRWRLTLVGWNPAPAVLALRKEKNVEVTGTVDDVRPYYREALAAIVPLRTGGGTRLKILEAMAAGVPVVSTTLGAEGLAVSPGRQVLIADRDQDWLEHLTSLVAKPEFWRSLAAAGQELARARYDWEILGASLYNTYSQWLDQAA